MLSFSKYKKAAEGKAALLKVLLLPEICWRYSFVSGLTTRAEQTDSDAQIKLKSDIVWSMADPTD